MDFLSRRNMVTTLTVFVLLLACSICSGVATASGAYILEDGAGIATYLSDAEELEFMELQFSQYYLSSSRSLGPAGPPPGCHTCFTPTPEKNACGGLSGLAYQCCMSGKHVDSNYKKCV